MSTNRLVKWSKESQEFFEKAEDGSVILDLVISYGCATQNGEGFEELINTINSDTIKEKVTKVVITDTSYLYRHLIPHFSGYVDPNIPTKWFLRNKNAIEKLKCPYKIKSWVVGLEKNGFQDWHRQIKQDLFTDSNLKNEVISLAMEFTAKEFYDSDIGRSIDFIIEETAYTVENLKGANIVYPTGVSPHIDIAIKKYNLGTRFLSYKASNCARKHMFVEKQSKIKEKGNYKIDIKALDKEVLLFMKEKVSNVNFFVLDKYDNHIYRNYTLGRIIGIRATAKEAGLEVWENNRRVIDEGKPITVEEKSPEGYTFLSVKHPLIINGKIEGVIGLAVDITDRRKREEIQEELYNVARMVSHDIAQPVTVLKGYLDMNKSLSEKERKIFKEVARSIESIAERLLVRYRNGTDDAGSQYVFVRWCLERLINQRIEQYKGTEIEFKSKLNNLDKFVFIVGNFIDFNRMISNLINNAVEAMEEEKGTIEITYAVEGQKVEIRVKDNGKGMPKETVEKIEKGEKVGTTKKKGHGLGMQQIMDAIKAMRGKVKIESKENVGTEFVLTFPKTEKPVWFKDKIELKKGNTLVILDDELLIHTIWKEKLKIYEKEITVKYFRQGVEALKFLKSVKEKNKVFLLADYELRNQDITGVNVIEKGGMKDRHILITNMYLAEIKDFEKKRKYLKTFHKMYLNDINIELVDRN